jgi:tetratricopeptide (TPR) repeat protein
MSLHSRRLVPCLCLIALAAPAPAQEKAARVGEEVAPKTDAVSWYAERDGRMVPGGTFNNPVGTVVRVAPDYYLVHWRGRDGWVKRDDVVAGDERFPYFVERARRNPSDAYAQRVCAQNYLSVNLFDTALPYVEAAARLAPNDIAVRQTRAMLLAVKGDRAGALAEFAAAERINPSDPMTYTMRAAILWRAQREYDRAVADFDRAVRLAPNDETIYAARWVFWLATGNHARALADMDTCVRLWPGFLEAHVARAELLANCPDRAVANPKEAVVSARRACELTGWEDSTHVRRLARTCELAGYNDEAVRWRQKAEQMEASNAAQLPPLPPAQP